MDSPTPVKREDSDLSEGDGGSGSLNDSSPTQRMTRRRREKQPAVRARKRPNPPTSAVDSPSAKKLKADRSKRSPVAAAAAARGTPRRPPLKPETGTTGAASTPEQEMDPEHVHMTTRGARGAASGSGGDEDAPEEVIWHPDQVALNIVLKARNEYSLMEASWRISLRGIPFPENLFYRKTQQMASRPRIYNHCRDLEHRGGKILRRLIDLPGKIRDLRATLAEVAVKRAAALAAAEAADAASETGSSPLAAASSSPLAAQQQQQGKEDLPALAVQERVVRGKIASNIRAALQEAIAWADRDAGLLPYARASPALPPNLQVIELSNDDLAAGGQAGGQEQMERQVRDTMGALAGRWRAFAAELRQQRRQQATTTATTTTIAERGEEGDVGGEEMEGVMQSITTTTTAAGPPPSPTQPTTEEEDPPVAMLLEPPVIFGFIVRRHVCFVVTQDAGADAGSAAARCHIPIQMSLAERAQQQWNALAVLVTVCWARDLRMRLVRDAALEPPPPPAAGAAGKGEGQQGGSDDDPDA